MKENLKISSKEVELLEQKLKNVIKELEEKEENLKIVSENQLKNDASII